MKVEVKNCNSCPLFTYDRYPKCGHPEGPGEGVDDNEKGVHSLCPLLKSSINISIGYNVETFDGHLVRKNKTYEKWLEKHPSFSRRVVSRIVLTEDEARKLGFLEDRKKE